MEKGDKNDRQYHSCSFPNSILSPKNQREHLNEITPTAITKQVW